MEKKMVFSGYLKKEVEIACDQTVSAGELLTLITHDSLCRIYDDAQVEHRLKVTLSEPYFAGDRIIFTCRMTDNAGKDVIEIGETCRNTLPTQIGQDYAATMAAKRAFDAAAIRFFQLAVQKAYSAESIQKDTAAQQPDMQAAGQATAEPEAPANNTPPAPAAVPETPETGSAISSQTLPENYEEELTLPAAEVPALADAPAPAPAPAAATAPAPAAPAAPGPPNPVVDFGKNKGKTVEQLMTEDPDWCEWAVQNLTLSNENKRSIVEAIKARKGG